MLELIVLGKVPGTGIVVTFPWILGIATTITGLTLLYIVRRHRTLGQFASNENATA